MSNKRTILAILIVLSLLIGSVASVMAAPVYQEEATVVANVVNPGTGWTVVHTLVVTDTKATTTTKEVTATETTTATEEVTATEATTATEEVTATEATTATEEVTATETTTATKEVTATETTTATEEVTATEATTATEEVTATETITATEEVTATEEATTKETATTEATTTVSAEGCTVYTVVAGDTLGTIADAQFGNVGAYQAIADATNAMAATDDSYATIADVNVIEIGQKLCIPADGAVVVAPATTTATATQATTEQATTEQATTGQATTGQATTTTGKMMLENTQIAEGMVGILFENLSGYDVVLDLIEANGATIGTQFIPPNTKHVFVVKPGSYNYNGSTPGGGPGVSSGGFEVKTGQWVEVIIYGGAARQITVNEMVGTTAAKAETPKAETAATTTTETASTTTTTTTTTKASANEMLVKETKIAEGMVAVLFENLSGGDVVIDLIGPTKVDAQFVGINTKHVFVVKPGSYNYNGSSISSGGFDVKTGQWVEVIIYGGEKRQINVNDVTTTEETTTTTTTTTEEGPRATEMISEQGVVTATEETTTEKATTETTTTTEDTSLAPTAGKARMYYQNLYTEEYVIDFGDGSGPMVVKPGLNDFSSYREFAPGKYNATVNLPGAPPTNFDVELGAGTSWIVRVTEDLGVGTAQVYP